MIGLSSASRLLPENADKAEIDHLVDQYQHIFTVVAELETKHSTPGFAWDLYTPFTTALHNDGHTETLVHLIMRSSDLEGVEAWLSTHEQEVDSLQAWLTSNTLSTER